MDDGRGWKYFLFVLSFGAGALSAQAATPSLDEFLEEERQRWAIGRSVPVEGWSNRYDLPATEIRQSIRKGKIHSLHYPVGPTGVLIPHAPMKRLMEKGLFKKIPFPGLPPMHSMDDLYAWTGMHPYPLESDEGPYAVPYPKGFRPEYRMGVTLRQSDRGTGFTFSCAACHSARLFDKTVLGLTNRFPRANALFALGKTGFDLVHADVFQLLSKATDAETEMYRRTQKNLRAVETKLPAKLGLDTSLAHTALSLSRRKKDELASKSKLHEFFPHHDPIRFVTADSKPGTWWNLKYKNRWGADGSMVGGNPILTNLLWNEIGRGSDLAAVEAWIDENIETIKDLTSAVFSIEAPRFTDFFPPEHFRLQEVLSGEQEYKDRCAKCHGNYHKAWNLPGGQSLPWIDQLKTVRVEYFEKTPVKDVGTSPYRAKHMQSLIQLNDLRYSKKYGIVLEVQEGYVPPPLVGIWARWPYFHNNSIPSLCALLSPAQDRPKAYYAGPAHDKDKDFDRDCNGYPSGKAVPRAWRKGKYRFNTRRKGLSNKGHGRMLKGLTEEKRRHLIRFLQTL